MEFRLSLEAMGLAVNGAVRLFGSAALLLSLAQPAVRAAQGAATPDARPICSSCEGRGERTCGVCRGAKQAEGPCFYCDEDGKQDCTYKGCNGGRRICRRCSGMGVIPTFSGGRRTGYATCGTCNGKRSQDCPRCASGKVKCKECRGKNTMVGPCRTCNATGKLVCSECGGEGRGPLILSPQTTPAPVSSTDPLYKKYQRETLAEALRLIGRCDEELAELGRRFEVVRVRYPEAREIYSSIRERKLGSISPETRPTLKNKLEDLRSAWRPFDEQYKKIRSEYDRMRLRRETAKDHVSTIRKLETRLKQPKVESVDPLKVREIRDFSHRLHNGAQMLRVRLGRLSDSLKRVESAVDAFNEKFRQAIEDHRKDLARQQAIEAAFGLFRENLAAAGAQFRLQGLSCTLMQSSSSPGALAVEVVYRDAEAEPAEELEQIEPTESYIRRLPDLLTKAFGLTGDVQKIVLKVLGKYWTRTGREKWGTIQSFSVKRDAWMELVSGRYRDDWEELLARSNPMPPYPRPGFVSLDDESWSMTLLVLFFGLAVALVIVARMRFS